MRFKATASTPPTPSITATADIRAFLTLALLLLAAGPASAAAGLDEGIRLFEARQFPEASRFFEGVVKTEPGNAGAAYYLGRLAFRAADYETAVTWLEKAVAGEDLNSMYHLWLGRAYGQKALQANIFRKMSLAGKCREQFERAVQLDGENLDARSDLISYYIQAPSIAGGSIPGALEQAAEIKKRDVLRGHRAYAAIHEHEKDYPLAEKELRAAMAAAPDKMEPRLWLGYHYQKTERYDDAFRLFEETARIEKGTMNAHYQIARTAVLSGRNLDHGVKALEAYLQHQPGETEPSLAWAHFRLGQIYEKKGSRDLARKEYETTVRLDATHREGREALEKIGG